MSYRKHCGLGLDTEVDAASHTGVMIPPTGVRAGYFFSAGLFSPIASAIMSTYLRPAPVLKMTTRSDGLRKPVESRGSYAAVASAPSGESSRPSCRDQPRRDRRMT